MDYSILKGKKRFNATAAKSIYQSLPALDALYFERFFLIAKEQGNIRVAYQAEDYIRLHIKSKNTLYKGVYRIHNGTAKFSTFVSPIK